VQDELIKIMSKDDNLNIILFPREYAQEKIILNKFSGCDIKVIDPTGIVNGPSLIAKSDLVICGGGTMSREAATLGVPSYSYFGGILGDVDRYLSQHGKLIIINSISDLSKLQLVKREANNKNNISTDTINFVYDFLKNKITEYAK
jgi:predicted glycosyltransferase